MHKDVRSLPQHLQIRSAIDNLQLQLQCSGNMKAKQRLESFKARAFTDFNAELERIVVNLTDAEKSAVNMLVRPGVNECFGELLARLLLIADEEKLTESYRASNASVSCAGVAGYYIGAYKLLGIGIGGAVKGGWLASLMAAKGGAIAFGSSVWWAQALTGLKAGIYSTTWLGMFMPYAILVAVTYGSWKGWGYVRKDARRVAELENVLHKMSMILEHNC